MSAGARITIDDGAIARNTRLLRASAGVPLIAVLKADAFGHGHQAANVLAHGADAIGVTSIDEGRAVRREVPDARILSWLNPADADWAEAIDADLEIAVPSATHLLALIAATRGSLPRVPVHLHIDVGMARDGAPRDHWNTLVQVARAAERNGAITVVGLMGHLSSAAEPGNAVNATERLLFENACRHALRAGLRPAWRHLAATAATLSDPASRLDAVRVGAGLFGIDPAGQVALEGAMTLDAPVVSVRRVPAGTGVGYGLHHRAAETTTLALLPLGYGDGVPRRAAGVAEVLVGGRRRPIVGDISMDQIIVDMGDDAVALGDRATLLGPGHVGEPVLADWATWSDTIAHEIVTGFGARLERRHLTSAAPRTPTEGVHL